jgi:hypothetical protein
MSEISGIIEDSILLNEKFNVSHFYAIAELQYGSPRPYIL